jgi:hypothetical protein
MAAEGEREEKADEGLGGRNATTMMTTTMTTTMTMTRTRKRSRRRKPKTMTKTTRMTGVKVAQRRAFARGAPPTSCPRSDAAWDWAGGAPRMQQRETKKEMKRKPS